MRLALDAHDQSQALATLVTLPAAVRRYVCHC
jgi:hypothetical protein